MQSVAYFPWSIVNLYDLEALISKLKRSYVTYKLPTKETFILKIRGIPFKSSEVTELRKRFRDIKGSKKINVRLKDLCFNLDGVNWKVTFNGSVNKREVSFESSGNYYPNAEQKKQSFIRFWESNIKKRLRSRKFKNFMLIGIGEYFDMLVLLMGIIGSIASFLIIPHAYSNQGLKFPILITVGETGIPSLISVLIITLIIWTDGFLEPDTMMAKIENGRYRFKDFFISNYANYLRFIFLFFSYSIFYDKQMMGTVSALPEYYLSHSVYLTLNGIIKAFLIPLILIGISVSIIRGNWVSRIKIRREKR